MPDRPAHTKLPHPHPRQGRGIIVLIGVTKLIKSVLLLLLAFEALHLVGRNVHDEVLALVEHLHFDPEGHQIHGLLQQTLHVTDATLRTFAVGFFLYAGLYLIEGIGLLMDYTWAEAMATITTAGFIPFELSHFLHHPTLPRLGVVLLNALIVVYLVYRLYVKHRIRAAVRHGSANPASVARPAAE